MPPLPRSSRTMTSTGPRPRSAGGLPARRLYEVVELDRSRPLLAVRDREQLLCAHRVEQTRARVRDVCEPVPERLTIREAVVEAQRYAAIRPGESAPALDARVNASTMRGSTGKLIGSSAA